MEFLKFMFCLLIIMATAMMMAFSTTIRSSDRIVFQDSTETETHNVQQVTPVAKVPQPNLIYQPARQPTANDYPGNQYSNNPFLKNVQATKKSEAVSNGGGPNTNRLSSADKPSTTTTLEEETNREGKSSHPETIEIGHRILIDTPKHCPSGEILVNGHCHKSV